MSGSQKPTPTMTWPDVLFSLVIWVSGVAVWVFRPEALTGAVGGAVTAGMLAVALHWFGGGGRIGQLAQSLAQQVSEATGQSAGSPPPASAASSGSSVSASAQEPS